MTKINDEEKYPLALDSDPDFDQPHPYCKCHGDGSPRGYCRCLRSKEMSDKWKTVLLLSGGLDSSTLLYALKSEGHDIYPISFHYGQRHGRELVAARDICLAAGLYDRHRVIDLGNLRDILPSALTCYEDIPEGHYTAENMKSTVVPNRNMILLSIAAGYAKGINADLLAYAAHTGDHAIYPDCRPDFIKSLSYTIYRATGSIDLITPFEDFDKAKIIQVGVQLNVPYELTWTCYNGREKACGKCGACVERLEAFELNDLTDPIEYEQL